MVVLKGTNTYGSMSTSEDGPKNSFNDQNTNVKSSEFDLLNIDNNYNSNDDDDVDGNNSDDNGYSVDDDEVTVSYTHLTLPTICSV